MGTSIDKKLPRGYRNNNFLSLLVPIRTLLHEFVFSNKHLIFS